MAESDLVALPDGALDDVAARVGTSLHGSADGTGLRIGIGCAEFNGGITLRLLEGALLALDEAGTAIVSCTEPAVVESLLAQPPRHLVDLSGRLGTGIEALPGYEGVGW